jgi:hypothetical protein
MEMPHEQNENDGSLSPLERIALDNVEKSVRNARNILLTLTVICAFLFAVIFETFFGWPNLRPSGSHEIFVKKITELAQETESEQFNNLTTLERGICSLAAYQFRDMVEDSEAEYDTLMLKKALENKKPHEKERYLAVFAQSIRQYEESLKKAYDHYMEDTLEPRRIPDAEKAGSMEIRAYKKTETGEIRFSVTFNTKEAMDKARTGIGGAGDKAITATRALGYSDPDIEWAVREILNRDEVNQRIRKLSSSRHPIPIIGVTLPLEDINIVVSTVLLLLVFWLASAARRMRDSVELCHPIIEDPKYKREERRKDLQMLIRLIASSFFFIECEYTPNHLPQKSNLSGEEQDEREPLVRLRFAHRAALLIFFPYLIVASGALGTTFYENLLLDIQRHGEFHFFAAATFKAQMLLGVASGVVAALVFRLAYLTSRNFYGLYKDLVSVVMVADGQKAQTRGGNPPWRPGVKAAFWLLGCLPGIVFGSYILIFWLASFVYRGYFLNVIWTWAYGAIVLAAFIILYVLLPHEPKKRNLEHSKEEERVPVG